jgi:hypothetical protein
MPRVSLAFFTVAALCGLTGMVWGSYMGMHQDFTLSPAHAHLNLLGWVTLSIMGVFYMLAGERAQGRLAWVNFALSASGVVVMTPLLAQLLMGNTAIGPMMAIPEILVIGGMLTFIASIVRVWRAPTLAA